MTAHVLIDGDQAFFQPTFGPATVAVRPGRITGSGPASVDGAPVCVDGDEASVSVPGCTYSTPTYPLPGTGTLAIAVLAGDQRASKTRTGGTPVLLVGSSFTARLTVVSPASQPSSSGAPIPDSTLEYTGTGMFVTSNLKLQGV